MEKQLISWWSVTFVVIPAFTHPFYPKIPLYVIVIVFCDYQWIPNPVSVFLGFPPYQHAFSPFHHVYSGLDASSVCGHLKSYKLLVQVQCVSSARVRILRTSILSHPNYCKLCTQVQYTSSARVRIPSITA